MSRNFCLCLSLLASASSGGRKSKTGAAGSGRVGAALSSPGWGAAGAVGVDGQRRLFRGGQKLGGSKGDCLVNSSLHDFLGDLKKSPGNQIKAPFKRSSGA